MSSKQGNDSSEQIESDYTFYRITELNLYPVNGNFNADHLKEIHRRIFQDLPKLGITHIIPGVYRPSLYPDSDKDWMKERSLESVTAFPLVAYSPMSNTNEKRIDQILQSASPVHLKQLNLSEFIEKITAVYAELDYIHPFTDGNSRTLRVFTEQLASSAGFSLCWENLKNNEISRDMLYIARDRAVSEYSIPNIKDHTVKQHVIFSVDQFPQKQSLFDIIKGISAEKSQHNTLPNENNMSANTFLYKQSIYLIKKNRQANNLEKQITEKIFNTQLKLMALNERMPGMLSSKNNKQVWQCAVDKQTIILQRYKKRLKKVQAITAGIDSFHVTKLEALAFNKAKKYNPALFKIWEQQQLKKNKELIKEINKQQSITKKNSKAKGIER